MNTFYVALDMGLEGYYVKFRATTYEVVAKHLTRYFGEIHRNIYTEEEWKIFLSNGLEPNVINEDKPIELGSMWKW